MHKLLQQVKTTKTTDFLLPLLGKAKTWYTPLLVNAYLGDSSINKSYPKTISILIRFSGNAKFDAVSNFLTKLDTYVDSYDLLQGKFTMFIVGIPEEFIEDYSLILKGKYSKISKKAKELLLLGRSPKSPMPYILRKDPKLRDHWESTLATTLGDLDVWSVFEIEDEIFSLEDFPIKPSVF